MGQLFTAAAAGAPLAAGGLDLLAGGLDEVGLPLADDDVAEQLLLLTLLQHPAELAWLQEVLDTVRWPPPAGEAVAPFDALRAQRLDAVLKEVMRLTPPVGDFFRLTREPIALAGDTTATLLPFGGGERVCLGRALAELEIRLLTAGMLKQLTLEQELELDQDLTPMVIPSASPKDGLLVRPRSRQGTGWHGGPWRPCGDA